MTYFEEWDSLSDSDDSGRILLTPPGPTQQEVLLDAYGPSLIPSLTSTTAQEKEVTMPPKKKNKAPSPSKKNKLPDKPEPGQKTIQECAPFALKPIPAGAVAKKPIPKDVPPPGLTKEVPPKVALTSANPSPDAPPTGAASAASSAPKSKPPVKDYIDHGPRDNNCYDSDDNSPPAQADQTPTTSNVSDGTATLPKKSASTPTKPPTRATEGTPGNRLDGTIPNVSPSTTGPPPAARPAAVTTSPSTPKGDMYGRTVPATLAGGEQSNMTTIEGQIEELGNLVTADGASKTACLSKLAHLQQYIATIQRDLEGDSIPQEVSNVSRGLTHKPVKFFFASNIHHSGLAPSYACT